MCFKSLCNAMRGIKLDNSLQKSSGPGAPLRRILSSCIIILHILGLYLCPSVSQNGLIFSHMVKLRTDASEMPCSVGVLCARFYSYFVLISKFQFCLILKPKILTNAKRRVCLICKFIHPPAFFVAFSCKNMQDFIPREGKT